MKQKTKKWLIILGTLAVAGFLIFSAAWLVFYYRVAKPHLPADFEIDDEARSSGYTVYYCPENAYGNYDRFDFYMPKFGKFRCPVGFTSSRSIIEEEDIIVNMSGSKFAYSMTGLIGWNGKINHYYIAADYYADPQIEMPEGAFFEVDHDGTLLNTDTASARDLELFQEAKPEIMDYIRKIDDIYSIQTN